MSDAKEVAGRKAVEFVEDGMLLGLGTGSTVFHALVRLAERIRDEGLRVRGVPTSRDTHDKALRMGIPLVGLESVDALDLTIDGADEVDARFDMIKGGGGALLREKIVASISRREVIVVDRSKLVQRLGTTFALPVEVVPFALTTVDRALRRLDCAPSLRMISGRPYTTDNGNSILDCRFASGIADAAEMESAIARIPGAVASGLFIGLAHALVIGADDGGVEVRHKKS